jgi:O-antigen/teichoic acid export membrane protein
MLVLNVSNALFQLVLIPILINHTAAENMGAYFIALSYSVLASVFINFGTSQTAVIELRKADSNEDKTRILAETAALRILPLLLAIIVTALLPIFFSHGLYFLLVLPILAAEFINPQFFLISDYKIQPYALLNLGIKLVILGLVFYMRESPYLIEIAILATGFGVLLLHLLYLPATFLRRGIWKVWPSIERLGKMFSTNALVLGNGLTVHLQQSLFLFALPSFVTPLFLSAYGFVDKLISSFRMLVNAYSASFMPQAAITHQIGFKAWQKLKRQQNVLLSVVCIAAGLVMYFFPEQLLYILLLGKTGTPAFLAETARLMQFISPVPFFIAMNVLNVAELILEKQFVAYFGAGVVVLIVSLLAIDALYVGVSPVWAGFYPLLIESACLLIYGVIVRKVRATALLAFLALGLFSCNDNLPDHIELYRNHFDGGRGDLQVFAGDKLDTRPLVYSFNGNNVLGPLNHNAVYRDISNLPEHDLIEIYFDIFIHDQWKGNDGLASDYWGLYVDQNRVFYTTFSNLPNTTQAYPEQEGRFFMPGANSFSKNLEVRCSFKGKVGGTSMYQFVWKKPHSASNIKIALSDLVRELDPCVKSWSIDNLIVTCTNYDN